MTSTPDPSGHPPAQPTPPQVDPATAATAAPVSAPTRPRIRRTRSGAIWVGVIIAAVVLVLLLVFILQNSRSVKISYLGMHGHLSLAVAMLLSAIAGILLVAIPGTARIIQLRHGTRPRPDSRGGRRPGP